ncbi:MAG: bifunctional metallophosphatase/5'-nucleotidase [bacterium]|nr:bifunctional metallophosphatase/5'-nucleotidase [bacterium]
MNRKKGFAATVVLLFCFAMILPAGAQTVTLKLIETSDVHGSFFPYDFIKAKEVPSSLAQVYAYVKEQRANPDQHVILLDNGDILQGQPTVYYSNFEKTDSMHICAEVMNFMQYDASIFGNHDVEAGHAVYDKLAQEFEFPWLAANAVRADTGEPYLGAYAMFEKDGVKIAVLGLTTPGVPNWLPENLWEGIEYRDMVESARKWVSIIQEKEQPDLLIGLFHSGADFTYKGQTADTLMNENASEIVAQKVPGFDVVFVGHDHQGWNKVITNDAGEDVLILGAINAAKTAAVANIVLSYDDAAKSWSKEIQGEIIESKNYPVDEEYMSALGTSVDEVKAYVDKPIGKFMETISIREAMFGDSPFVDLIHRIQLELTDADVSFADPLSFDTTIDEGEVYVRDMFKLYKYENLLYSMKLSGQEIKDFLEFSYGLWFNQMQDADDHLMNFKKDENGQFIWSERSGSYDTVARYYNYDSAAGINYSVDVSKPEGERITIDSLVDGTPFDVEASYKVAINSYRGNGGGGHLTKGAGIPKEELTSRMLSSTVQDLRYFLMKWIEKQQVVTPEALGNWQVIPTEWWEQAKERDYVLLYESEAPK